jgi:hypothetical protein
VDHRRALEDQGDRSVHRDWLNAEIEKRLVRTPATTGSRSSTTRAWPAAHQQLKEVFEEPQVKHLGILKKVVSPRLGEQTLMGQPVTLTRTPSTIARAAPTRGEHPRRSSRDRLRPRGPRTHENRRSLLMNDMTLLSTTERVKTWVDGQVLHIRFNNPPKHNALSVDMWEAVPPLLGQAEKDDNVRVVVFSGEGGKAFVSGADISQFEDMRARRKR